jgi:uncharacterized membrane protein YfcA
MDPVHVLLGCLVGILIGLTGVGGGSLLTPLLLLTGYNPVLAIGSDLAYGAVTKTVGGWRHLTAGRVDLRLSRWLAYGSVPGALLGVLSISVLYNAHGDDLQPYLLGTVAAALLLASLSTLYRALLRPGPVAGERDTAALERRASKAATVLIGLSLGFVLGLTSVGSGALIGVALILLYKLDPRRVVGTDVFHAAIVLWAAALVHLVSGNVDVALTVNLLIGSLPGVLLGTRLVALVAVHALRCVLGIILFAAALGVGAKAGVAIPAPVLAIVPFALAATLFALNWRREAAR